MSFLDFCFSSSWEREREREWYTKFGYKGETSPKLLILFFRWCSTGESFFFHGLIDFILFSYTGLKNLGSFVSQVFFCLQPGVRWLWFVCPLRTLLKNWLSYYLFPLTAGESPLPFWGPSQSFGFSLPPLPVFGDLRLLSTNTCWHPLCDPHSLLTVTYLTARYC